MKVEYHPGTILLSFFLAVIGIYLSITCCEQYRLCRSTVVKSRYIPTNGYLVLMAFTIGGVGIWCMHFIGMSAVTLYGPDGKELDVLYANSPNIGSLLLCLVFVYAGMWEIKHITSSRMLWIMGTQSLQHLLGGGFLTGGGVVLMHYVGMVAMKFDGHIRWNPGIVAASIIIAFTAATAAFWILFRLLSIYPNKEVYRLACSLVMSIAVCGMHYTGMLAASFEYSSAKNESQGAGFQDPLGEKHQRELFIVGLVFASVTSIVALVLPIADLRFSVLKLAYELSRADDVVLNLRLPRNSPSSATVYRYLKARTKSQFNLGIINGGGGQVGAGGTSGTSGTSGGHHQHLGAGGLMSAASFHAIPDDEESSVHSHTTSETSHHTPGGDLQYYSKYSARTHNASASNSVKHRSEETVDTTAGAACGVGGIGADALADADAGHRRDSSRDGLSPRHRPKSGKTFATSRPSNKIIPTKENAATVGIGDEQFDLTKTESSSTLSSAATASVVGRKFSTGTSAGTSTGTGTEAGVSLYEKLEEGAAENSISHRTSNRQS